MSAPAQIEAEPAAACEVFGSGLEQARRYAALLADDGVVRGLIGPQEAGRIWSRHLLNCAVVADLVGVGARVVDIGSGAGLPGVALAIRRPDLQVDLVEPLERRVSFLREAVGLLGLDDRVRVVHGRAESAEVLSRCGRAHWVTARAVAPLDRLVRWCLPLLAGDGRLALLKGRSVQDELDRYRASLRRAGAGEPEVRALGAAMLDVPTTVVVVGLSERARVAALRKGRR